VPLNPDEARELLEAFTQDEEEQIEQAEEAWVWWKIQKFILHPYGSHAEAWKPIHDAWQPTRITEGPEGNPELRKQLQEILQLVHADAIEQLENEGLPEDWASPTE